MGIVHTFISSRLAGRDPGFQQVALLLGREGVAFAKDTTIEAGRLELLLRAMLGQLF